MDGHGNVLLIREGESFWGLPKGHIEHGESRLEAAQREIGEEAGVAQLKLITELGTYTRHPYNRGLGAPDELKHITLFLFMASTTELGSNQEGNEIAWVELEKVGDLLTHDEDRKFFNRSVGRIRELLVYAREVT